MKTNRAHGFDISKHQGSFVMPDPPPDPPIQFAIQRLSIGIQADQKYAELREAVVSAGIAFRMGYHYLITSLNWEAQADKFLSLYKDRGYHAAWLDFEGTGNNLTNKTVDDSRRWIEKVAKETGHRTGLYTNVNWYTQFWKGSHVSPLWLAQYWYFPGPDKIPGLGDSGLSLDEIDFWQYSADTNQKLPWNRKLGGDYGVESDCIDLDVFMRGGVDELNKWLGLDMQPEPPSPPVPPSPTDPMSLLAGRVEKMEELMREHGWM